MKKLISLCVVLTSILLLSSCKTTTVTVATTSATTQPRNCQAKGFTYKEQDLVYNLVWSDEFDGNVLDQTKWKIETGGSGFGNNEKQYYTNGNNLEVVDGHLILTARREQFQNRNYTSSKITSQGKGDFKYGKFEIKAKLPEGKGTWPAIWMMPSTSRYGSWPNSGEIDIMEHVGYDLNKVHGTVHTGVYNHRLGTQKGGSKLVTNASTEFHVYSIEWLPNKIKFLIDGEVYYTFQLNLSYIDCPNTKQWPFDQNFYLILNIAMGGDWGGSWDKTGDGVDPNFTETQMVIDYVRVYQSDQITSLVKQ